jgi:hypothetical protein
MPTDCDEFILDTDASNSAIGAVLSQRQDEVERVVAYASRALDKREQNYCVTRKEKELLAVVHFVRYFKQYLLGRTFKLRTDHAALSWLRHTPDPIGQQARWLEQLEEYDFSIEHRPGIRHGNADAMSRRPCNRRECACHGDGVAVPTATHESNEHEVRRVRTRQQARKERHTRQTFWAGRPITKHQIRVTTNQFRWLQYNLQMTTKISSCLGRWMTFATRSESTKTLDVLLDC